MPPKFPGPYIETTNEDDPIMKRTDQNNMEIGARKSGMPKDVKNSVSIEHVGDSATGKK